MPIYQSPGVYVEELDTGLRPIEISGTSTAAFLGLTHSGPELSPTSVESYQEFSNQFGGVSTLGNLPGDPMALSVRGFFQNGGAQAFIVNTAKGSKSSKTELASLSGKALVRLKAKLIGSDPNSRHLRLTPRELSNGRFDVEVIEQMPSGNTRILTRYSDCLLAPGLPNSIEEVFKNDPIFQLELNQELERKLYPNITIPITELNNAASFKIEINGMENDITKPTSLTPGALQNEIEQVSRQLDIEVSQNNDDNSYTLLLRSPNGNSKLAFQCLQQDGTSFWSETSSSRAELINELLLGNKNPSSRDKNAWYISGFEHNGDKLNGTVLDIQIGGNSPRRVWLSIRPTDDTADSIAKSINNDLLEHKRLSMLEQDSLEIIKDEETSTVIFQRIKNSHIVEKLSALPKSSFFKSSADVDRLESNIILTNPFSIVVEKSNNNGDYVELGEINVDPSTVGIDEIVKIINDLKNKEKKPKNLFEANSVDNVIKIKALQEVRLSDGSPGDSSPTLSGLFGSNTGFPVELNTNQEITTNRFSTIFGLRGNNLAVIFSGPNKKWTETINFKLDSTINTLDDIIDQLNKCIAEEHKNSASLDSKIKIKPGNNNLLIWSETDPISIPKPKGEMGYAYFLLSLDDAKNKSLAEIAHTYVLTSKFDGGKSGEQGDTERFTRAFELLEAKREISIICLPGTSYFDDRSRPKVEAAILHAETMKDRMVIIDPPEPKPEHNGYKPWKTRSDITIPTTSSYAVMYYPWLRVSLPPKNPGDKPQSRLVGPSGFIAGVWSATDSARGPWKAPAGIAAQIYGIQGLEEEVTDVQGGALNQRGVNALRDLPIYGSIVWGARTLATPAMSEWKYLPVRRTIILIEDSLKESLAWAVHQPNKETLWSALRLNVEAFLNRLLRQGAFQSNTPRTAYYVQCGLGSTMTQADINAGILRLRVGVAPVKPAEFIIIEIEQINQ